MWRHILIRWKCKWVNHTLTHSSCKLLTYSVSQPVKSSPEGRSSLLCLTAPNLSSPPLKSTLFALYLWTASITVRSPSSLSACEIGSVEGESQWLPSAEGAPLRTSALTTPDRPSQTKWTSDTLTCTALMKYRSDVSLLSFFHLSTKAQAVEIRSSTRWNPWQNTSPLSPLWVTMHTHTHLWSVPTCHMRSVSNQCTLSFTFTSTV